MTRRTIHKDYTAELTTLEKVLYHIVFGIVYLVSLLPFPVLYALSDVLYLLVYKVVRYRTKLVRKNLCDSFPEKSADQIISIEKKFYHFLCDYFVETIKLASISDAEIQKRMVFTHVENMQRPLLAGKNVAIYLGHQCNWEWITSIGFHIPDGTHGSQVYHTLKNNVMDKVFLHLRERMGTECVTMENILKYIVKNKTSDKPMVIGFISDQVPFWNNIHHWLTFMNHPDTPVLTGTERLAKKYDFACVYFDVQRTKRGYYVCDIKSMTEEPKQYSNWELTEMYFTELERTIRHQPEYWLWTHNRWKRTREQYNKMIDPQTGKLKF